MTWQIFVRAAAESDLESLSGPDRRTVASELCARVERGPPRYTPHAVFGVSMFDDTVPSGFRVTYAVYDEQKPRLRRPYPEGFAQRLRARQITGSGEH